MKLVMVPYWALVVLDHERYRRRSEGFRLRAPRSFLAVGSQPQFSYDYGNGGIPMIAERSSQSCGTNSSSVMERICRSVSVRVKGVVILSMYE